MMTVYEISGIIFGVIFVLNQVIDSLQELVAHHHNAPTDLIGYLTQTAETLITEENERTGPEPVSIYNIENI